MNTSLHSETGKRKYSENRGRPNLVNFGSLSLQGTETCPPKKKQSSPQFSNQKCKSEYDVDSLQLFQQQIALKLNKKPKSVRNKLMKTIQAEKSIVPKQVQSVNDQTHHSKDVFDAGQSSGTMRQSDRSENNRKIIKTEFNESQNFPSQSCGPCQPPLSQVPNLQIIYPPYQPPQTQQLPYQLPQTQQSPYQPPQTQQLPYQSPQTQQSPYQPPQTQQPPFMYPFPYPYFPSCHHRKHRSKRYEDTQSESSSLSSLPRSVKKSVPQSRQPHHCQVQNKLKLRKVLNAVAFTVFLKGQSKRSAASRKRNLHKFQRTQFHSQILQIRNWLLEAHRFALAVILEKRNLSFQFNSEKSQKVKLEKQRLIVSIIKSGIKQVLEESIPSKMSPFAEILVTLCRRNSFPINKFWTALEMSQLRISEYFGFIRADENVEKFLIGNLVFIKVFLYNMFLQPHKFDEDKFPKDQQPLQNNMLIIGSVYYHMIKEVLVEFIEEERDLRVFEPGNWLKVSKQFHIECSQPLVYAGKVPEDNEYISGLIPLQQLDSLRSAPFWSAGCQQIKACISKLHTEMLNKAKLMHSDPAYRFSK